MPNSDIPIPLFLQNVLSYGSGIALASYFFYYLAEKLQIYQIKKFNPKLLVASLILFFIVSFGGIYLITKDINLSKTIFLIAASIVAVYFCVRTIYYLIKQVKNHTKDTSPTKSMIITGNLAIIFMTTMPFVAHFENVQ